MISYLRTLSPNPINSVLNGGVQPETRLFPLGDKPHCYVMLCYDHISRTIGNYLFVEKNWMHSLSVLENLRGLCVTVSVYFLVLLSSLSLCAVILACHFTL